jgi:hypothetical protein
MNPLEKILKKTLKGLLREASPASPASSGADQLRDLVRKYNKLREEHDELLRAYAKLKAHCDQISNRILDLERDQRDVVDGKVDIGIKSIGRDARVVCVVASPPPVIPGPEDVRTDQPYFAYSVSMVGSYLHDPRGRRFKGHVRHRSGYGRIDACTEGRGVAVGRSAGTRSPS